MAAFHRLGQKGLAEGADHPTPQCRSARLSPQPAVSGWHVSGNAWFQCLAELDWRNQFVDFSCLLGDLRFFTAGPVSVSIFAVFIRTTHKSLRSFDLARVERARTALSKLQTLLKS